MDKNGLVNGVYPGTATITATSVDKRSDLAIHLLRLRGNYRGCPDSLTRKSGSAARSPWRTVSTPAACPGKLYGTDSDFETDGAGFYVVIRPATMPWTFGQGQRRRCPSGRGPVPFRQATSTTEARPLMPLGLLLCDQQPADCHERQRRKR